jgi:hypothetical protein
MKIQPLVQIRTSINSFSSIVTKVLRLTCFALDSFRLYHSQTKVDALGRVEFETFGT